MTWGESPLRADAPDPGLLFDTRRLHNHFQGGVTHILSGKALFGYYFEIPQEA
jgi:hypothetical protein